MRKPTRTQRRKAEIMNDLSEAALGYHNYVWKTKRGQFRMFLNGEDKPISIRRLARIYNILLEQGRICETTYWYLDDVEEKDEDGFYSLPKPKAYKDFEAFLEGLLWNLEIARENGDEVPSEGYLLKQAWEHADWVSPCINGAYFAICTQRTVEDVWEN